MNSQILRGKDGRRWLLVEGQGACVELPPVEPPKKTKGKPK